MTTAEAPDPKTFKNWEDAFKYPIPSVRRLQQQLKGDVASNREKLRVLVGTSYRDLLGTADTIVHMDAQMQKVEQLLNETSKKCNSTRLERGYSNSFSLGLGTDLEAKSKYILASQITIFRKCPDIVARILRRRGSVLLASKLLVISRLLHKKLSESDYAATFIAGVWARLLKLRHKLLYAIDRRLTSPDSVEGERLVEALGAYALATSTSSVAEILRHFHVVRLEALTESWDVDEAAGPKRVLQALKLWIRTLEDTRSAFPKQVASLLVRTKVSPLFDHSDVRAALDFDLDVHEKWLGDDVRSFTPYLRHDDLDVKAAAEQLSKWAPKALKSFGELLNDVLSSIEDPKEVAELRKSLIVELFANYHVKGVRKSNILLGIRESFNKRLHAVAKDLCKGLVDLAESTSTDLQSWSAGSDSRPGILWSEEIVRMDSSEGARKFTESLHSSLYGKSHCVKIFSDSYSEWLNGIDQISEALKKMRAVRWDDYMDEVESDTGSDSSESESSTSKTRKQLSAGDPDALSAYASSMLGEACKEFYQKLGGMAASLADTAEPQGKACYLFRIYRETMARRSALLPKSTDINADWVDKLYTLIASPVAKAALHAHQNAILKSRSRRVPLGRLLWDGELPLPVLPSPWAFKVLMDLEDGAKQAGIDLWTDNVKDRLGEILNRELVRMLSSELVNGDENTKKKGEKGQKGNDKAGHTSRFGSQDNAIQHLFDLDYITTASSPHDRSKDLSDYRAEVSKASGLDDDGLQQLEAAVQGYQKKTELLFGAVR